MLGRRRRRRGNREARERRVKRARGRCGEPSAEHSAMRLDPNEVLAAENDEIISKYQIVVDKINALEEKFEKLSDDELKIKTEQFQQDIKKGVSLDSILVEAFAVVSFQRFYLLGINLLNY